MGEAGPPDASSVASSTWAPLGEAAVLVGLPPAGVQVAVCGGAELTPSVSVALLAKGWGLTSCIVVSS